MPEDRNFHEYFLTALQKEVWCLPVPQLRGRTKHTKRARLLVEAAELPNADAQPTVSLSFHVAGVWR
jgi:hypothetical protein